MSVRPEPPADDDILTARQVSDWLKISVRQIQRLAIPFIDCGPRNRRFLRRDVLAFLEAQRSGANAKKSRQDASGSPITAGSDP